MQLTDEQEKQIGDFLARLAAFDKGENNKCLHCRQIAKALSKQGRSVYAEPCGCRQYQGNIPNGWKKSGHGNWYVYVGT